MILRSKIYDISMIILIIIYTVLILVQFALEEQDFYMRVQDQMSILELCILGVFVIEIGLHFYSYRLLYLKDYWNIADIVVIILSILFDLLDLFLQNS